MLALTTVGHVQMSTVGFFFVQTVKHYSVVFNFRFFFKFSIQGGQKSKPLSSIIIKSY